MAAHCVAAPTASTTVTSQPWNCSTPAAVSPAMPAPITTTRRLRKGSVVPTALASVVLGAVEEEEEEEVLVLAEAVADAITGRKWQLHFFIIDVVLGSSVVR
jgi:hypothetical protein